MESKEERNIPLTQLVEEHDEVILFCERIRVGLKNKTDLNRIKKYVDWFKEIYLDPHFEIETKYIFPILGITNVRVKRGLANHRRLQRLFAKTKELNKTLNLIEEELSTNIGFEERVLYTEIRKLATKEQWEKIEEKHKELTFDDTLWKDQFWKS